MDLGTLCQHLLLSCISREANLSLRLPLRASGEAAIVILNHLSIAIRRIAFAGRSRAAHSEFRLKLARKLDFDLTERIDDFVLEHSKLRRIIKDIWVDATQLFDHSVEVAGDIAVASKLSPEFLRFGQTFAKFAFKLTISAARRPAARSRIRGV